MKMRAIFWLAVAGAFTVAGCSGSQVSVTQPPGAEITPIHRIAIMPGSGVLGDSIAKVLNDRGVNVTMASETDAIL